MEISQTMMIVTTGVKINTQDVQHKIPVDGVQAHEDNHVVQTTTVHQIQYVEMELMKAERNVMMEILQAMMDVHQVVN